MCLRRATDCVRAASELLALVVQYGGKAKNSGTVAGAVHRGGWQLGMRCPAPATKRSLMECERGEDVALVRYRKAMKHGLPAPVREVVERQMTGVQTNHDEVKALRDGLRARN